MKLRPILFSAPMVRAILDGRKTVTRRIVKSAPSDAGGVEEQIAAPSCIDMAPGTPFWRWLVSGGVSAGFRSPYGVPGDRLWVRETWRTQELAGGLDGIRYAADDAFRPIDNTTEAAEAWVTAHDKRDRWRPSIFMRLWMSRITLEVTDVRVERLHAITEEDAEREGVERFRFYEPGDDLGDEINGHGYAPPLCSYLGAFEELWDAINGKRTPWADNPWVWRVAFRRVAADGAA